MLRHYVEEGGALIVTGWTGLFGQRGEALEHSAIESLIGARFVRRLESRDNHVSISVGQRPENPRNRPQSVANLEPDWPFLVEGPAVVYEPTSAAPIGDLHGAASHCPSAAGQGGNRLADERRGAG